MWHPIPRCFTVCYVRFLFQTACQHTGQHFKALIRDSEGSSPVRKNWLVMQDYIPLALCLRLSLNLFVLFSSCLWQRFKHMFGQLPWNRCMLHMMNKQAFQGSPYWLGSLRLIIQLIMVNNFPLSLIEMIRYTKWLDEDWNRPLFCIVQSRQHKPKDVGTYSYSKSSCNSIIGSLAFLLERWTLCLKSNNVKSVQIVRCFTESCR